MGECSNSNAFTANTSEEGSAMRRGITAKSRWEPYVQEAQARGKDNTKSKGLEPASQLCYLLADTGQEASLSTLSLSFILELLWGSNEIMRVECLAQCLVHLKFSSTDGLKEKQKIKQKTVTLPSCSCTWVTNPKEQYLSLPRNIGNHVNISF